MQGQVSLANVVAEPARLKSRSGDSCGSFSVGAETIRDSDPNFFAGPV
jgi:hypothetical protein